jgi:hypothetical protein
MMMQKPEVFLEIESSSLVWISRYAEKRWFIYDMRILLLRIGGYQYAAPSMLIGNTVFYCFHVQVQAW